MRGSVALLLGENEPVPAFGYVGASNQRDAATRDAKTILRTRTVLWQAAWLDSGVASLHATVWYGGVSHSAIRHSSVYALRGEGVPANAEFTCSASVEAFGDGRAWSAFARVCDVRKGTRSRVCAVDDRTKPNVFAAACGRTVTDGVEGATAKAIAAVRRKRAAVFKTACGLGRWAIPCSDATGFVLAGHAFRVVVGSNRERIAAIVPSAVATARSVSKIEVTI